MMNARTMMHTAILGALLGFGCGTQDTPDSDRTEPDLMDSGSSREDMSSGVDMPADVPARDMEPGPDLARDQGNVSPSDMPADMEDMSPSSSCMTPCDTSTPVCDETRGVCVECLATSDCGEAECDTSTNRCVLVPDNPDLDGDGTLNVLVLGTSRSIASGESFDPTQIASELQSILASDPNVSLQVNVVAEDIYASKEVLLGLGSASNEYTWLHSRHSLAQYYYWPDGLEARQDNLAGRAGVKWDHVIIGADPHIAATLPGYYALGVKKIAAKVTEGGAQPHLLMLWGRDDATIDHLAEQTRRISHYASVELPVIPAGLAWQALPDEKRDMASVHPSPHGAYLAAASIYTQLYGQDASASDHTYDDEIARVAHDTLLLESMTPRVTSPRTFDSPFKGAGIADRTLSYNHTGTSSERGILGGLRWVLGKARVALRNDAPEPIHFNYGRANTNFEANKRYKVDPAKFDFSLGFPMQDAGSYGDESMRYGLDKRLSPTENGTDLGVALYMEREGELPHARAIPIRTLYAQLHEIDPMQSAYRDNWHMHRDLDKSSGAFMYTLLTGHCALDEEPMDTTSDAWGQWAAHKVGYETAWAVMHLSGMAPCFKVLPESEESISIEDGQSTTLSISFMTAPTSDVTVTISTDAQGAVMAAPSTLVFTPDNYNVPQQVTLTGANIQGAAESVLVTSSTSSADIHFDNLSDHWRYALVR